MGSCCGSFIYSFSSNQNTVNLKIFPNHGEIFIWKLSINQSIKLGLCWIWIIIDLPSFKCYSMVWKRGFSRPGVRRNYIWSLAIVVIIMGLGGAKRRGGGKTLKSSYARASHETVAPISMEELTPLDIMCYKR